MITETVEKCSQSSFQGANYALLVSAYALNLASGPNEPPPIELLDPHCQMSNIEHEMSNDERRGENGPGDGPRAKFVIHCSTFDIP
jgi:hypothetical protein